MDKLLVSMAAEDVFGGFFVSVPPGHIGCIYSHGKGVLLKIQKPGLHLKLPFWHRAKLFNVQTQQYVVRRGFDTNVSDFGDDAIEGITKDGIRVRVEMTILYHINPENATQLWQNVGDNYLEKVVRPVTRSRVRRVISQYDAADLTSAKQAEIEDQIESELKDILIEKSIIVENVLLSGVSG
jgi:regulator of protease activity HflC (stomatin/prohibitin superfamily)